MFISIDYYANPMSKEQKSKLLSIIQIFPFKVKVRHNTETLIYVYDQYVVSEDHICYLCKYILSFEDVVPS